MGVTVEPSVLLQTSQLWPYTTTGHIRVNTLTTTSPK